MLASRLRIQDCASGSVVPRKPTCACGVIPSENRFAVLGKIHHRTLVVHGAKDFVVMLINAFLLPSIFPTRN
jgi:hypothetical protein